MRKTYTYTRCSSTSQGEGLTYQGGRLIYRPRSDFARRLFAIKGSSNRLSGRLASPRCVERLRHRLASAFFPFSSIFFADLPSTRDKKEKRGKCRCNAYVAIRNISDRPMEIICEIFAFPDEDNIHCRFSFRLDQLRTNTYKRRPRRLEKTFEKSGRLSRRPGTSAI